MTEGVDSSRCRTFGKFLLLQRKTGVHNFPLQILPVSITAGTKYLGKIRKCGNDLCLCLASCVCVLCSALC